MKRRREREERGRNSLGKGREKVKKTLYKEKRGEKEKSNLEKGRGVRKN